LYSSTYNKSTTVLIGPESKITTLIG